VARR
jgi:hypothetical protein